LNKFAVVPEHFILATKENKPQTHVLEESDLEAAVACIEAYEQARQSSGNLGGATASSGEKGSQDDGLFVFFNGGLHSGASQAHRHLQLLPVSRMKEGLEDQSAWEVLAQQTDALQRTPFITFFEPINTKMSSADLFAAYSRVYTKACQAAAQDAGSKVEAVPTTGEALISYNMAITKDTLVICPRKQEGYPIKSSGGRENVGSLALNGTVLAGTALVKNEAEWEALKKSPEQLLAVLRSIGISRSETEDGQNKL
jgi:ATP adenylyltransferase